MKKYFLVTLLICLSLFVQASGKKDSTFRVVVSRDSGFYGAIAYRLTLMDSGLRFIGRGVGVIKVDPILIYYSSIEKIEPKKKCTMCSNDLIRITFSNNYF